MNNIHSRAQFNAAIAAALALGGCGGLYRVGYAGQVYCANTQPPVPDFTNPKCDQERFEAARKKRERKIANRTKL